MIKESVRDRLLEKAFMYTGDLIGTQEVCSLLKISIPTLSSYRKKFNILGSKIRKEVKFSKVEVLTKLYTHLFPTSEKESLCMIGGTSIEYLKIDETTYDLRKIKEIDGHGLISLLCHLLSEMNDGKFLHLLIDQSNSFLNAMNFFGVLSGHLNSNIFWSEDILNNIPVIEYSNIIKLPVRRLGVVGAQNKIVDDLTVILTEQGYSIDICSYIGWAMGELADNSATHATNHPSFVYFEQYGQDNRYLQFTIGDIGIGIPDSLRRNEVTLN